MHLRLVTPGWNNTHTWPPPRGYYYLICLLVFFWKVNTDSNPSSESNPGAVRWQCYLLCHHAVLLSCSRLSERSPSATLLEMQDLFKTCWKAGPCSRETQMRPLQTRGRYGGVCAPHVRSELICQLDLRVFHLTLEFFLPVLRLRHIRFCGLKMMSFFFFLFFSRLQGTYCFTLCYSFRFLWSVYFITAESSDKNAHAG